MKKHYACLLALLCSFFSTLAQQVAINEDGSLPNPNAILDVKSFTKGVLIPRMSTANRLAIPNTKGLLVYDTTVNAFFFNTGSLWQNLSAATGESWSLSGNSGTTDSSFLGTIDSRPLLIRTANELSGAIDPNSGNTTFGFKSNRRNSGSFNTITGFKSMEVAVNNSSHNTAVGAFALRNTQNAAGNTGIGAFAMQSNVIGGLNTSVGFSSMTTLESGSRNTGVGAYCDAAFFVTNSTAIGHGAFVNLSNKVRIGNAAVTVIEGPVPFTTPSDGRFKYRVQEDVKGLDFIMQLRPVTYNFDVKRFDDQQRGEQKLKDQPPIDDDFRKAYDEAAAIRRTGFIAQEVEKAAKAAKYDFSGIVKPKKEQEHYSLSYESFVVPLVKAVQEQQKLITDLQKQVAELKQQLKRSN